MALFEWVRDALGGGTLSFWMLGLGIVALWLALKAVVTTVKLALLAGAAFLLLGVFPWAGEPVQGEAATCAAEAVADANSGVRAFLTKRITVEELSADAACTPDGQTLASGSATVRLRTWADVPFQTWTVSRGGVQPR